MVACSNAVNITDGLDGLATVVALPGLLFSSFIAFSFGEYEIAFFASSLCVSLAAFLVFNWYPAQLFMGDVGSLPLGAVWAFILLMLRQELLWPLMGIISLIEIFSVVMQVFWFKRYKRRVFLMTPLHHHFELLGWHETKITICAGIISVMSCLITALLFL
jgi:phospho-N-acetylmuramoyl-pentapeptide-transferase